MNNPPFARLPLLVDSLASDTGNNMYIVKKGKILDQVNIGELNIGYPDYLCYTSEFGVIDVLLRGTGRGTNIMPKNPGFSCGPMPVEPDFREQETISNDVVTSAQGNNPIINDIINDDSGNRRSEFQVNSQPMSQPEIQRVIESRAERTRRVTDISRTIDCDGERATVEIRIKPQYQMTGFRYIESIPKACLPSLSSFDIDTDTLRIDGQLEVAIVEDPLIMWRFNSITREQRIEYELDACLRECEELIQGMAFAERIVENTGQPVEADSGHEEELHEGDIVDYVPADVVVLHSRIEGEIVTQTEAAGISRDNKGDYPNTVIGQYKALQEAVEAYPGSVRIEIQNTVGPVDTQIDQIVVHFRGVGNGPVRRNTATTISEFITNPLLPFATSIRDNPQIGAVLTQLKGFLNTFVTGSTLRQGVRFDVILQKESEEGRG